jgi:hypothetical protein
MIGDYSNPTWTPGETLTAAKMQTLTNKILELDSFDKKRAILKKSANQSCVSDATVNDDNTFNITLVANKIYEIELNLKVGGVVAAGFKCAWVKGAGITMTDRICVGPIVGVTSITDTNATFMSRAYNDEAGYGTENTYFSSIKEKFLIYTSASNNTLKLQWAQASSTANNTTVYADSYMKITEVIAWA